MPSCCLPSCSAAHAIHSVHELFHSLQQLAGVAKAFTIFLIELVNRVRNVAGQLQQLHVVLKELSRSRVILANGALLNRELQTIWQGSRRMVKEG